MDGTIICTKSGRVFALNTDVWQLLYTPQVKQTLQRLYQDEGYKIVFITNQNGIASGKTKVPDFCRKVESIVETLGVPIQLFAATEFQIQESTNFLHKFFLVFFSKW